MGKFIVMRKPVLMEDEGRYQYLTVKDTREEAERFATEWCARSRSVIRRGYGYFARNDLFIRETEE